MGVCSGLCCITHRPFLKTRASGSALAKAPVPSLMFSVQNVQVVIITVGVSFGTGAWKPKLGFEKELQ